MLSRSVYLNRYKLNMCHRFRPLTQHTKKKREATIVTRQNK